MDYHASVALHEFHPLNDGEIAKIPPKAGIYLLFQIQVPVHVDGAENLQKAVRAAKKDFPRATHFAIEAHWNADELAQRKRQLKEQLSRVRKAGFTGPTP
jgi:hypothetical protein